MSGVLPTVTPLDEDSQNRLKKSFLAYKNGFVQVGENGHLVTPKYSQFAKDYYNFPFKSDDVLIMTFPKCGTTWTQEIIWPMMNKLDFEAAKNTHLYIRSPFVDFDFIKPDNLSYRSDVVESYLKRHPNHSEANAKISIDLALNSPSPRTIKTHFPFSLFAQGLIDKCKVVYVVRNPKDACVSYYYHQKLIRAHDFTGDFEEFMKFWCDDLMLQGPYWEHIKEAWDLKDHPNMHFMFYEDMKQDIMKELKALDKFLGTGLSEEDLLKVKEYSSFPSMKERYETAKKLKMPSLILNMQKENEGSFIRKGTSGGWKDYFTPEIEEQFQAWMKKHESISSIIPFKYSL